MGSISEFPIYEPNTVQMADAIGSWLVRVVGNGRHARLADFELESSATAFADGQRIRLGLASFERV